jgi:K+-sensing histidine kinase KdpD
VNEKAKLNIPGYKPTVVIGTKKLAGKIEIKVQDNGNGIPQKHWIKYFNHFLQLNQQDRNGFGIVVEL